MFILFQLGCLSIAVLLGIWLGRWLERVKRDDSKELVCYFAFVRFDDEALSDAQGYKTYYVIVDPDKFQTEDERVDEVKAVLADNLSGANYRLIKIVRFSTITNFIGRL